MWKRYHSCFLVESMKLGFIPSPLRHSCSPPSWCLSVRKNLNFFWRTMKIYRTALSCSCISCSEFLMLCQFLCVLFTFFLWFEWLSLVVWFIVRCKLGEAGRFSSTQSLFSWLAFVAWWAGQGQSQARVVILRRPGGDPVWSRRGARREFATPRVAAGGWAHRIPQLGGGKRGNGLRCRGPGGGRGWGSQMARWCVNFLRGSHSGRGRNQERQRVGLASCD